MCRLAYVSTATQKFSLEDLNELATKATWKNEILGITGYLCHNNGTFFQVLEGPEDHVESLYQEITLDARHTIKNHVQLPPADQPLFPDWDMRHLKKNELCQIQLEHILEDTLLNMDVAAYGQNHVSKTVLSMITKISERQHRLVI